MYRIKNPNSFQNKSIILSELLDGNPHKKTDFQKDLKTIFGIERANFEFHLYSKKDGDEGLITSNVITSAPLNESKKSRDRYLNLNLYEPSVLMKTAQHLQFHKDKGKAFKNSLDRLFMQCVTSSIGDGSAILDAFTWVDSCQQEEVSDQSPLVTKEYTSFWSQFDGNALSISYILDSAFRLVNEYRIIEYERGRKDGKASKETNSGKINSRDRIDITYEIAYIFNTIYRVEWINNSTPEDISRYTPDELTLRNVPLGIMLMNYENVDNENYEFYSSVMKKFVSVMRTLMRDGKYHLNLKIDPKLRETIGLHLKTLERVERLSVGTFLKNYDLLNSQLLNIEQMSKTSSS